MQQYNPLTKTDWHNFLKGSYTIYLLDSFGITRSCLAIMEREYVTVFEFSFQISGKVYRSMHYCESYFLYNSIHGREVLKILNDAKNNACEHIKCFVWNSTLVNRRETCDECMKMIYESGIRQI